MNHRHDILEWAEQGRIAPQKLRAAMELGGALPDAGQWRRFVDALLLYGGAVSLAAGVIFFFAYNWADLHRYAKFGLIEAGVVVALLGVLWSGLDSAPGKAALLLCSLLAGALLALIGQTYQTGADTYELFASWALFILPWVVLARFAPLWLLWLAILNVAFMLYFRIFGGLFGVLFGDQEFVWVLLLLNTAALAVWEVLAVSGIDWLKPRWAPRLLMTASAGFATLLAMLSILDWRDTHSAHVIGWVVWLGAAYVTYRMVLRDLYALAIGVLSVIVVTATFLGKNLFDTADAGAFLLVGLIVIALSAAGGWWLRQVAAEART